MVKDAKAGDTVELKDKEAGFTDPDTGFDISRSQKKELTDPIGKRTQQAIMSGGLIVVTGEKKSANLGEGEGSGSSEPDEYDLPADLPGRDAFIAAGYTEFEKVKALETDEQLLAVKGIGPGTVKNLKAWAEANKPKE